MAYTNPCNTSLNPSNTGVSCDSAMKASAQFYFMPRKTTWTQADIDASPYNGSVTAFLEAKTHLAPALRWFPIFGTAAAIQKIDDSNESDVTETMDDGSTIFVRYGKANRTFTTTKGGLCLAKALMKFPEGYSFIEVDIDGKIAWYEPTEGVYAGFPTNMLKGLTPELANLKTAYKNKLMISFDPVAYIVHGKILSPDSTENVLGINGLLDAEVTAGTGTHSTTNIFVGVKTECAETDLVELYTGTGAGTIGQISNFIVKKKSDGSVVTPSAVAIISGEVRLTGTYTSGADYTVALAAPAMLKANGISGYEGIIAATVSIP